ncbi:MAG: tetratricopeptide repeat protein [Myxococcota bacterium]|nr:tetratricopeptide repeat protein [Myxococcota bacterium]
MSTEERSLTAAWLVLAGLVVVAFGLGLYSPFTYDDKVEVIGNQTVRAAQDWQSILSYNWARPLVLASYAMNYQQNGMDPFGYHLFDLMLQVANAGLALLVVTEMLRVIGHPKPLSIAFFAAAFWSVHPLATESVVYVTGRSEQLLGFFVLYGLWLWTRWLRLGGWLLFVGAWAAVIGAGLCKESAAVLPAAYFSVDYLLRPTDSERPSRWAVFSPGAILLAAFLGARWAIEGTLGHPNPQRALDTQFFTQAEVTWRYISMSVLPTGQSIFHDFPETGPTPRSMAAVGGLLTLGIYSWRKRKSDPIPVLGFTLFVLFLAPTFWVPLKETMAEHRTYLSLLGASLMASWGIAAFRAPIQRSVGTVVLAGLLLACILRTQTWSTEVSLWADAASKAPQSAEAQYGHGEAQFYASGDLTLPEAEREALDAVAAYQKAVEIDPEYLAAWNKLGIAHAQQGENLAAIAAWQALLSLDQEHCKAHTNLGKTFVTMGQTMEGLRELESAVAYCPNHAPPHYFLGLLYQDQLSDPDKAIFHFQRLLGLDPDFGCPFGKEIEGQMCVAEEVRGRLNSLTW